MITHTGGCHCGKIRFRVTAPERLDILECNCSICAMAGYLHLIVPRSRFELIEGEADLTTYTFNTGIAQHYFCAICGMRPFYIPRSHPDGYSVNARCLDPGTVKSTRIMPFDGANWEASVAKLGPTPD